MASTSSPRRVPGRTMAMPCSTGSPPGPPPVSAVYELAATAGRALEPGDQISYYVTGRGAGVAVNEHAKLASQWDPTRPDENLEYYQAKVREIWERFRPFTEFDGLRPYVDEPEPQLSLF